MKPMKTIGHSNHPIERFLELVKAGGVELLVDVRSMPYSRRFPQFSRERLAKSLAGIGVEYVHEPALGGKPEGGASYDDLARHPAFGQALDRLAEQARARTVCLMCAEKEPLDCHRTVLVSRRLTERGVAVEHLLADGRSEPHAAIEDKLLAKEGDLFEDRAARLARAYRMRERTMKGKAS